MIDSLKKLIKLFDFKVKTKFVGLICLVVIGTFLELLGVGAIPAFIMIVADTTKLNSYKIITDLMTYFNLDTHEQILYAGSILLILIFIIKNLFLTYLQYVKNTFIYSQQIELSNRFFKSYLLAPYSFHLSKNFYKLITNANDETKAVVSGVMVPLMSLINDLLLVISIIVLLFTIEFKISFTVISFISISSFIFLNLIRKKIKRYGLDQQFFRSKLLESVNQGLSGVKEIRVLNRENFFLNKFNYATTKSSNSARNFQFVGQLSKPVIETISVIGMLFVVMLLLAEGKNVQEVIPTLTLFGVAAIRLMPALNQVMSGYNGIRYSLFAVDALYEDFIELKQLQIKVPKKTIKPLIFTDSIRIENLSVRYQNSESYAISSLSIEIKKGQAIAFVGASGAGKTTLADAILGLIIPVRGTIKVDHNSISKHTAEWQANIGYIPQNIYLIDDSISKNIALGIDENEINKEKLDNALRLAQLDSLIKELPIGINTFVGERGVRLSGGQRQRIGIARALYHNPQVLIMDEATSALDNVTEKYIIESLENFKGERTIIMIAHRLTTVKNCDQIYYMENGKIIDHGTYNELIEKNANFKALALVE